MFRSRLKTSTLRVSGLAIGAAAVLALGTSMVSAQQTLRISHQWSTGDVRHEAAEIVAEEVRNADVGLDFQIFPSQSLYGAREQWQPMSRGLLDMAVIPTAYVGGRHPEFNLTLMPGLVRNHDHARRLNESPFMERIEEIAEDAGVKILVHGWLAGGFAGKERCIVSPEDVEGMQVRAAGRAFEQMLAGANAAITSMPSSEAYSALQSGVLDGLNTSSASFVSYRLYEQLACFTPPGDYALWFMHQPLFISTRVFDRLSEEQQEALLRGAEKAEEYYFEQAVREDEEAIEVFERQGVEIAYMTEEDYNAWMEVAERTAFREFIENTPGGQELLDMARAVE